MAKFLVNDLQNILNQVVKIINCIKGPPLKFKIIRKHALIAYDDDVVILGSNE